MCWALCWAGDSAINKPVFLPSGGCQPIGRQVYKAITGCNPGCNREANRVLQKCGEEGMPWLWEPPAFTRQHGMQTIVPGGRREGIADTGVCNKEKQIGLEHAMRNQGLERERPGMAGLACCLS